MSKGNKIIFSVFALFIAIISIFILSRLSFTKVSQSEEEKDFQEYQNNSSNYIQAVTQNDISTCDNITDENTKNGCRLSYIMNNVSMLNHDNCKKYLTGNQFDSCNEWVYYSTGSCENIKLNITLKNNCFDNKYFTAARTKKESQICDKIKSESRKNDCKKEFEKK